ALLHLQDRALQRRADPVRGRHSRRRPDHRADQGHHQAGHRIPRRLPDSQEGRPLARLRRHHRARQPRRQLPHAVQQDHPDLLLPGARQEDEDEAGGVHRAGKAAAADPAHVVVTGAAFAERLIGAGFDLFAGVPCSLVEGVIAALERRPGLPYVAAVREDVAVGVAGGAWLAGRRPAVVVPPRLFSDHAAEPFGDIHSRSAASYAPPALTPKISRMTAIKATVTALGDELLVCANGYPSREACAIADRPQNFYMIGSMGLAGPIGLGVALGRPDRRTVVLDGDGNVLMSLGALTNVAALAPRNFIHCVFDNEVYGSTGNQASPSRHARLDAIAAAAGYRTVAA